MAAPLVSALQSEAAEISHAVLFVDDAAADAIAMSFGTEELWALGPVAVLPLPPASAVAAAGGAGSRAKRVVVLIGGPLELQACPRPSRWRPSRHASAE
jgi:hypothetical protein